MGSADEAVVVAFNAAINRSDLPGLGRLMADDHRFIDTAGNTFAGKPACLEAWRGFFASFPDYRNVFDNVRSSPGGIVRDRDGARSLGMLSSGARRTSTMASGRRGRVGSRVAGLFGARGRAGPGGHPLHRLVNPPAGSAHIAGRSGGPCLMVLRPTGVRPCGGAAVRSPGAFRRTNGSAGRRRAGGRWGRRRRGPIGAPTGPAHRRRSWPGAA
jgi:SnoaL-like domain